MQASCSGGEAGIESAVLDLGGVSLSELRTLDGNELRKALRHAAERVTSIPVTASGSQGAQRVD
jgi:hypothetical protein